MTTYLDRILQWHRDRAAQDSRSLDRVRSELDRRLEAIPDPEPRRFADALRVDDALAVISEIKRRSPSLGDLRADLDPVSLAVTYAEAGASCLSVLTDEAFFGGSPQDLHLARSAVSIPVLRKDFTVSALDVVDTRAMGADAVLLIAAALDDAELADFRALASEVGLDALVEIHDEAELERALAVDASLIGVNQRDLVTFAVDHARACRLAATIPSAATRVAESGVRGAADARSLYEAGYHAVLVGEALVTAGDPGAALAELRIAAS